MFIVVADHGGFAMKESLKEWLASEYGQMVLDCSPKKVAGDDYPMLARQAAIEAKKSDQPIRVIAFCRSGVGMALTLNRWRYMRAVQGLTPEVVIHARQDEDVNAVSIAADLQSLPQVKRVLRAFLETSFKPLTRYQRRLKELSSYGQA